jgi:hypothetical protein
MLVGINPQKLYSTGTASLRANSSIKQGMLVGKNPQKLYSTASRVNSSIKQGILVGKNPHKLYSTASVRVNSSIIPPACHQSPQPSIANACSTCGRLIIFAEQTQRRPPMGPGFSARNKYLGHTVFCQRIGKNVKFGDNNTLVGATFAQYILPVLYACML